MMPNTIQIELSGAAFTELTALAKKNGRTVEEQTRHIIQERIGVEGPDQRSQVSLEFLRQELDAVLRAAERGPVHIIADGGREFVIIAQGEYERLTDAAR